MERLTLRQLEVFTTAAKLLSFTKTARAMHMSKPAITKQMQNIEAFTNVKLFKQTGKKIYLTGEAKTLLPQANKILEEVNFLTDMVQQTDKLHAQFLSVGAGHTFTNVVFPLLQAFSSKTNVEFDVTLLGRKQMTDKLREHKLDAIITGQHIHDSNLTAKQFMKVDFFLVASSNSPLAKATKITSDHTAQQNIILLKDHDNEEDLLNKFQRSKMSFSKVYYLESYAAIKEAVKSGLGIGFVPETLIHDELKLKTMTILPYSKLNYTRILYLITHKGKSQNAAVKQLNKFLLTEASAYK